MNENWGGKTKGFEQKAAKNAKMERRKEEGRRGDPHPTSPRGRGVMQKKAVGAWEGANGHCESSLNCGTQFYFGLRAGGLLGALPPLEPEPASDFAPVWVLGVDSVVLGLTP